MPRIHIEDLHPDLQKAIREGVEKGEIHPDHPNTPILTPREAPKEEPKDDKRG